VGAGVDDTTGVGGHDFGGGARAVRAGEGSAELHGDLAARVISRSVCIISHFLCPSNVVGGRGRACGQAGGLNAWGLAGAALACHAHGTDAGEAGARRGRAGDAASRARRQRPVGVYQHAADGW